MTNKITSKLDSEIYSYLEEIGGYSDYNQKIEDLVEEFGLDSDTAENYVCSYASGTYNLYEDIKSAQVVSNIYRTKYTDNIKASEDIQYIKKSKLESKGLTEEDIDDITLRIIDVGDYYKIIGDSENIWNVLHRYDLQYSTEDSIYSHSKARLSNKPVEASSELIDIDDLDYISAIAPYKKFELIKHLTDELYDKAISVLKSPKYGFDMNDISHYLFIEVNPIDAGVVVEVRCELSYEGLYNLVSKLNSTISKYDKDAYFDMVEPGIAEAYIRKLDTIETNSNKITIKPKTNKSNQSIQASSELIDIDDYFSSRFEVEVEVTDKYVIPDIETCDCELIDIDSFYTIDFDEVSSNICNLIEDLEFPDESGRYLVKGVAILSYSIDGEYDPYEDERHGFDYDLDNIDITYYPEDSYLKNVTISRM